VRPYTDLYSQICAWENIEAAYRRARKGKRCQAPAADFERKLEDNLVELQNDLMQQTYQPGAYHSFYIHEPKRRLTSAAPFRDRVVHHALCQVIEPLFEQLFIQDSYANRVGKGTHRALDRCQEFARRYPDALQLDVVQFFPSLDHALLRAALARVIADEPTLWLCDVILQSGVGVQAEEYRTPPQSAQGGLVPAQVQTACSGCGRRGLSARRAARLGARLGQSRALWRYVGLAPSRCRAEQSQALFAPVPGVAMAHARPISARRPDGSRDGPLVGRLDQNRLILIFDI
jgi:hypothetical protein